MLCVDQSRGHRLVLQGEPQLHDMGLLRLFEASPGRTQNGECPLDFFGWQAADVMQNAPFYQVQNYQPTV